MARREWGPAAAFLAPSFLLVCIFSLGPAIASIGISFTQWNGLGTPKWIGVSNYIELVHDGRFLTSLGNTALFTAEFTVLTTALSLAIALLLTSSVKAVGVIRFLWFLPFVTDLVSVSLVWGWLYQPQFGILNYLLSLVGVPGQSWLGSPKWAMASLVVLSTWRWTGYYAVILVSGLQGVPRELVEAGIVDGASKWSIFFRIKLPLVSPVLFFVVILEIMSSFQVFEQMWVLTNGGPDNATISMAMYLYIQAFKFLRMGYGSAVAWVLFAIILVVTLINWRLRKTWVYEG